MEDFMAVNDICTLMDL